MNHCGSWQWLIDKPDREELLSRDQEAVEKEEANIYSNLLTAPLIPDTELAGSAAGSLEDFKYLRLVGLRLVFPSLSTDPE